MKLRKLRGVLMKMLSGQKFCSKLGYRMIDKVPRPLGEDDAIYENTLT